MKRGILGRVTCVAVISATCALAGGCRTAPDPKAALAEMTVNLVSSLPPGLDADAALAALDRAIAASPDDALYYSNRATVYRDAKMYFSRARADYDKAAALAPDVSQVYVNRGILHHLAGAPALARADFSKAIELDPKNALAFCRRGELARAEHQDDLGLADYSAAIALEPRRAEAFCGRGMLYARTGNYDAALQDLTRAIKLAPEDYTAWHERGLVYLEGKCDPARALADMDRAIRADPQQPMAHSDKARICEFLGRSGEALAEYRKVVKLASSARPAVVEQAKKRIAVLEDLAP
jgi:tetratricopeptide (TPR) repeat protein